MALALLDWFVTPMENDLEPLRLLTLQEAAVLLQVSKRTLERLISRKELPAFKVGRQWRIQESELTKFIQSLNELELMKSSTTALTPIEAKSDT
jgi:excisionase family DNA binding protein